MECVLHSTMEVRNDAGEHTATQIIGRVVMFHAVEELVRQTPSGNKIINYSGYKPLGRMGGDSWVQLAETIDIPRPKITQNDSRSSTL